MVKLTASEIFHPQAMETRRYWRSNAAMAGKRRPTHQKRRFRPTFIRQWRDYRNLTLEQLAARLEMTASHLSMLETGKRGYTQNTLEAIADALQTDAASLLMRDPTKDDAIWSVWDQAKQGDRQKIVDIARTIIGKTGT
jgi:transcriptional regulator with XRE-family HTH domain